jgi:uncharacterized protein (TIGR03089 family)
VPTPEGLFGSVLAAQPTRPLVTYYNGETGERSELSARSVANWVAKTYFLLTDELDLQVGDRAYVDLPAHWITVPILIGCWAAGLSVTASPESSAVGFVTGSGSRPAGSAAPSYAVAAAHAARGYGTDPPAGTQDYVAAVRPQPDSWAALAFPAGPDDPAIDGRSRAEVAASASGRAAQFGLEAGSRVLITHEWQPPEDWIDDLLAPLSVHGSVVVACAVADLDRLAAQERVTHRR